MPGNALVSRTQAWIDRDQCVLHPGSIGQARWLRQSIDIDTLERRSTDADEDVDRGPGWLWSRNENVTEFIEIPNRGHGLTIDSGWREVCDTALGFIQKFA